MKILWLTNTPCGAIKKLSNQSILLGGWLSSLAENICNIEGIDLHIAFYWHQQMEAFEFEGVTYHPILRDGNGSKLGRYIHRLRQLYSSKVNDSEINRVENVINEVNPDLIHFHGSEENFGLVAERKKNVPMILSIQGLLSSIFYKLYSGYQKADVIKEDSIFTKLMQDGFVGKERIFSKKVLVEQNILSNIDNIIGRTSWDRDCSYVLNPNRRYFVCNEILRSEFINSKEWNVSQKSKIVLVTTISNGLYKGLEMVFLTANLLTKQNIDFEWNVIGIAKGDKFDKLTQRITGVAPDKVHINLLGRKNASEMIETFNRSSAFVQVSHIENSSNSLCEAMVLGMPIIASYAGGTSSMLEDGKEGTLIQDGDPYRLAGAIIHLRNNYDHAVEMGVLARKRALIRHNPDNVVKELLTIYKCILEKNEF